MKKIIMIVTAAFAFIGSAYAACSYSAPETAWVYKWKFTGKTTTGKAVASSRAYSACSATPETCAIRVPASLKIEGYTYFCTPGCGSKSFAECAEVNEVFYCTKPIKDSFAGGVFNDIVNIIGKKHKQVEIGGIANFIGASATYDLTFSGFGKYDYKNGRIQNVSGHFAGFVIPCECAKSAVWTCDTLSICCDENKPTIASGKWSVKFQSSAAKKFLARGTTAKIPSWAQWKNRD